MSVDLVQILIDEKLLAGEITRLRGALPPEEFDNPNSDIHFQDALACEQKTPEEGQYAYAKFACREFPVSNNTKDCFDADEIRFQLLRGTREPASIEEARSGDALFQFLGAFLLRPFTNNPFNEHGLRSSTIIGPANARRLHSLFQQIEFDRLRPFYEAHCKKYDDGSDFKYLKSFEDFIKYVAAFDGLLLQAMAKHKTLYMYAS
jgi:hypothetical protein